VSSIAPYSGRRLFARSSHGERLAGLALIVGLHAALIGALLSVKEVREKVESAAPLMVSLITLPPKPEPAPPTPPVVTPPKPKPLPRMIVTQKPTPSPIEAVPVEPEPAESPPAEPEPAAPPVTAVEAAPAELPPVTPPSYIAAYLNNPAPEYSYAAKRAGEQGKVLLRVLVNAQGTADEVRLEQGSGYARLDEAAMHTVRVRWRFVPARQGDTPVAAWVIVPITFKLKH
jgi:protein TonB